MAISSEDARGQLFARNYKVCYYMYNVNTFTEDWFGPESRNEVGPPLEGGRKSPEPAR